MTDGEENEKLIKKLQTKDCEPCRLIGSATFFGIGIYIIHATRGGYYATRPRIKLGVRLLAVASFYMSAARFIRLTPFTHLAPGKAETKLRSI